MKNIIFRLEFAGYLLKTLLIGLVMWGARNLSFCLKRGLYLSLEAICWLAAKVLFGVKVEGRGNIPEEGNFIIIARHRSFWDIPLMAVSLGFKHQITFIGRKSLWALRFNPVVRPLVIFISRKQPRLSEVKEIRSRLKRGEIIGMFPEGTRAPKRKEPNRGAVLFAQKENIPILPLNIDASGPFGHKGDWGKYVLRKVDIELRIGRYFRIPKSVSKDDFVSLTKDILEDLDQI